MYCFLPYCVFSMADVHCLTMFWCCLYPFQYCWSSSVNMITKSLFSVASYSNSCLFYEINILSQTLPKQWSCLRKSSDWVVLLLALKFKVLLIQSFVLFHRWSTLCWYSLNSSRCGTNKFRCLYMGSSVLGSCWGLPSFVDGTKQTFLSLCYRIRVFLSSPFASFPLISAFRWIYFILI